MSLPINDAIIGSVSKLIDDSKSGGVYREPTHSDIEFYVGSARLLHADPARQGPVGKAKRVRTILTHALAEDEAAGAKLIEALISKVRSCGGFREASPNYVGKEAIANLAAAFEVEGFVLSSDGTVAPKVLSALKGAEMTAALKAYAARAQRGAEDAALVAGTGKDLMEATAAHVLQTINGNYPATGANFQMLLGMAFMALGMAVPELPAQPGEESVRGLERAMFQSACAVNRLRNKQGTGHGRPDPASLSKHEAKASIEVVGTVSAYMLAMLEKR
ncbi:abortive infection family protein [Janthinobacterium sp. SUN098]|uniref:abortive infection family protein n=2 Tax=Janthinobacterium TaxID=29580 RepID=UPI000C706667|nr:abortive infection family protein [Janthinobacterium sp. 61]PKV44458.1 abortive infection Abi-like protein [Janthinobacterium sp. 61]